ncbi:hypothetical protein Sbal223_2645 [Shewanella baltica OS223]|nr:hypothetical protein Sbal223_2645 [Shewanella baltica OS223]
MKPLSLSERLNQFAADQDDLSRRGEKNLAAEAAQAIDSLTAERDQLAALAEELKAMPVDALGDGWYDRYLACKKDVSNEHFDIDTVNDCDVLEWSEHYESEHRYSKSIADIRAKAVMDFAEVTRGAYLSGFVTPKLTIYDVYQSARNHVKDNYAYDTQPWDDDNATTARNALSEISACAGKAGFIAGVIHVNPTAEGRISLADEANKYADSIRQTAKDGE